MQRYEKYKDSGVVWIGEIPEHWECKRLGALLTVFSSKNHTDKPLLSITREKGVILRDLDDETENHNFIPDDLSGYKLIKEGQFGMNKMKAWQGSYGISDYDGIVSPAYFIFNVAEEIYPKFFHRAIRSKFYVAHFGSASDGVRIGQWDLSKPRMREIPFFIPPISEQQTIATFLDDKTAKIDQTIANKQKEIELLKERRQILIQKAVTKGLDDTVKLKDSGVEWIGEIPEHWEVRKLKYVSNVVLGKMICNEDRGNYHLKPYLKSKNIQWLKLNLDSVDEMWFSEKEMSQYKLAKGDIVVSEGGEVGKATLWNNELPECYIQNSAHKVTLNSSNNNTYHLFCFFLLGKLGVFESIVNKVSIGHLTREKLTNINFPHPTLEEQTQIVSHLEEIKEKIAKAILLKQQEIEKLKEYKTVLIDNVVTGKVRVS